MSLSRRQALGLGGGAVATLIAARAVQQGVIPLGSSPALAAWEDWARGRHRGPLALVSAGLLAASPHNTQPWRFAVSRFGVDIFEVPERTLGAMDPFGRERLAGLGGAIHNMALASTRIGRNARVRLLPDEGNPLHVARIELGPAGEAAPPPHPLLAAIGRRHTHRGNWTGAPLPFKDLQALTDFPRPREIGLKLFSASSRMGQRFAALTLEATEAIIADPAMMEASHHWFRHRRRDQDRLKDGLTVATSGTPPFLAALARMGPELDAATEGRYWLEATGESQLPTASLFGVLVAADPHDRRQALQAGMAWQRLHLIATQRGLVAQPLNQLPEVTDRARQTGTQDRLGPALARLLGEDRRRTTFAFRIGRASAAAGASLRRPVSEVLGPPARLAFEVDRARAETVARDAELVRRIAEGP
jgi:hypothetical protein